MRVEARVVITTKGTFVSFNQFIPNLKGVKGKAFSREILKQLRENGYQALNPVLYVSQDTITHLAEKGYKIIPFKFETDIPQKKGYQLIKEQILRQI